MLARPTYERTRMKITANQVFLHGEDRYEAGETYDVPDALGGYFVGVGWADADGIETGSTPDVVDLEPHDVVQGQEAPHHG